MKSGLFEAVLLKTKKTWTTYVTALCALSLGLLIDWLGGSHFLRPGGAIDLAGFKVVREALSATYGILFAVFIIATFCESRLLKKLSQTAAHLPESAELELWFLSPFSRSLWGSLLRAGLFSIGYSWLAVFSVVHIANKFPPNPKNMGTRLYVGIGIVDALILLGCLWFGLKIYQNHRLVRRWLEMIEERNT